MEATKRCPYCAETIREEAVKCRFCGSRLDRGNPLARTWYRRREGKLVAGVCTGLAEEFGISLTLVRLAFVLATFFGAWGLPIYVVLWVIMPYAPERPSIQERVPPPPVVREPGDDLPKAP